MRRFFAAVFFLLLFSSAFSRGGGGCFLEGTWIDTPQGPVPIESLLVGDTVLGFDQNGAQWVQVQNVFSVERDAFFSIKTGLGSVLVTGEHPFLVANGLFREARSFSPDDNVMMLENNRLVSKKIESVEKYQKKVKAFNLEVSQNHLFVANHFVVHNKGGGGGCFLGQTTVKTSFGLKSIADIKVGDEVVSFDENGSLVSSSVTDVYRVVRDRFLHLEAGDFWVDVTPEHPFWTLAGYRVAESLAVGDEVIVFSDNGDLLPVRLTRIDVVPASVIAYNLSVNEPNTFLANGFAVHNKGGGGGSSGGSSRSSGPPDNMAYFDCKKSDQNKTCCEKKSGSYLPFLTASSVIPTPEYPFCSCISGGQVVSSDSENPNIIVDSCYCTNDAAFSNKASIPECPMSLGELLLMGFFLVFFFGVWGIVIIMVFSAIVKSGFRFLSGDRNAFSGFLGEWSSTIALSKPKINAKAAKVSALLSYLASVSTVWNESEMVNRSKTVFLKLQECWEKRDYSEMRPLLSQSLFVSHVSQLEAMKVRHEINRLEELRLLDQKIVWVKSLKSSMGDAGKRFSDQFTVWVQAECRDTIVDDRTGKKIRGDMGIGRFEEFWTFIRVSDQWLLNAIDQPEEGASFVSKENVVENATPDMLKRIYEKSGKSAKMDVSISETREQTGFEAVGIADIKSKGGKVHRLLNFLSQTDAMWNEDFMREQARLGFVLLNTGIETRNLSTAKDFVSSDLFGKVSEKVSELASKNQMEQKRNLAVRNVEIVLVQNKNDRSKDSFTAWVSGQAQHVVVDVATGRILSGDSFVRDFDEYWSFVRSNEKWVADRIERGFLAAKAIGSENLDEDASKEMMDWYYSKDRA